MVAGMRVPFTIRVDSGRSVLLFAGRSALVPLMVTVQEVHPYARDQNNEKEPVLT